MSEEQPDGLLEQHKRHLLQGTAYTDPNAFTISPSASLRQVSQTCEDQTLTFLMQQLALTCRRLAVLEAHVAMLSAQSPAEGA